MDYAVDVVDNHGTTDMVFRSGATKAVQAGRERWRRALDTLRERLDIRCGPLVVGTR